MTRIAKQPPAPQNRQKQILQKLYINYIKSTPQKRKRKLFLKDTRKTTPKGFYLKKRKTRFKISSVTAKTLLLPYEVARHCCMIYARDAPRMTKFQRHKKDTRTHNLYYNPKSVVNNMFRIVCSTTPVDIEVGGREGWGDRWFHKKDHAYCTRASGTDRPLFTPQFFFVEKSREQPKTSTTTRTIIDFSQPPFPQKLQVIRPKKSQLLISPEILHYFSSCHEAHHFVFFCPSANIQTVQIWW